MAGLQDITPIVARLCVTSAVRAPSRAAAAAASQPAWPPPTTITSKDALKNEYPVLRLALLPVSAREKVFHVKHANETRTLAGSERSVASCDQSVSAEK